MIHVQDIELNNGYSTYYPAMIETMRENFATDPEHKYYISGAPQCPIPEPNSMSPSLIFMSQTAETSQGRRRLHQALTICLVQVGIIIGNATFDLLFVQFYNNNNYTYPCALPFNGK